MSKRLIIIFLFRKNDYRTLLKSISRKIYKSIKTKSTVESITKQFAGRCDRAMCKLKAFLFIISAVCAHVDQFDYFLVEASSISQKATNEFAPYFTSSPQFLLASRQCLSIKAIINVGSGEKSSAIFAHMQPRPLDFISFSRFELSMWSHKVLFGLYERRTWQGETKF